MWNLPKPALDDSINDLDDVEAHSRLLKKEHFPRIIDLYQTYDANGGHVSDRQHDAIDEGAKKGLRLAYEKTYGSDHHHKIAEDLKDGVDKCPMCDIGNANTLDHYMEKAEYPALAIMRQNLVPMCRDCNSIRNENKLGHDDMLHAYYDQLPTARQWLQVRLTFGGGAVTASFYPDPYILTDPILYNKALKTIKGLGLDETIRKDSSSFLSSLLHGKGSSDILMQAIIRNKIEQLKANPLFGLNHWKTVLLNAILNYPGISCAHLSRYL